jgi:hypothetical protein
MREAEVGTSQVVRSKVSNASPPRRRVTVAPRALTIRACAVQPAWPRLGAFAGNGSRLSC